MCHGDVVALRHLRCAKGKEDRELAGAEGFGNGSLVQHRGDVDFWVYNS